MNTLTLGFTSEYYTLWEVGEPERKYTAGAVVNGRFTGDFYLVQKCFYVQNLSKNYDTALAKITELSGGKFAIDLGLRGHSTFTRTIDGSQGNDMPDHVFTFGQLKGQDIRAAVDVWQLNRAVRSEKGTRRRAIARRRLIDLGELVRSIFDGDNWITPAHFRYLQEEQAKRQASGHHFENGKRITLKIKWIDGTSYDTQYGTVYIREYMTEDGKLVKYKGSSPISIDNTDFVTVTGTVEHSEYNGQPETRLKRMKKA